MSTITVPKKPLLDVSRIVTSIAILIVLFVSSLVFFGAWNKATANSEKISKIIVDISSEKIYRQNLEKNLSSFIEEQRRVNCKVIKKLDNLNISVLQMKYHGKENRNESR